MKSFTAIAIFGLAAIVSAQTTDATTGTVEPTPEPTTGGTVEATPEPTTVGTVEATPEPTTEGTVETTPEPTTGAAETTGTSTSSSASGAVTAGAVGASGSGSLSGYGSSSSSMMASAYGTGAAGAAVTVTQVVASFVTYCPGATQFSTNGQTYTATGPGYVTVTNCPCTITSVVGSTPTGPASNYGKGSSNSTYTGPKYTGAANKVIGASLSVVAAGAAFFAFAL